MTTLRFPVIAIPADGVAIDQTVAPEALAPDEAMPGEVGPIHINGTLSGGEGMYSFHGRLSGAYHGPCDRCAEEVELAFSAKVQWTFLEDDGLDDDALDEGTTHGDTLIATLSYDGDTIDLAIPIWEEVVLARPGKFPPMVEDGTECSVCGKAAADWQSGAEENEETTEKSNTGFAGLKDMFPDLPDAPAKE